MFTEALAAMRELLGGGSTGGVPAEHELELAAPDRAVLLADWLAELAYLAEAKAFVPERVARLAFAGDTLSAVVVGRTGEPPHLVKAVTYHRLEFARADGGWRGRVVLDV